MTEEEAEVDKKIREFQEKQGAKITLKVDKSKEFERLEQENTDLKEQVGDLESKLTIVAEEKFNERKQELEAEGKKLGLSFEIESPEELKAYQKLVSQSPKSKNKRDIPLSAPQLGIKNNTDDDLTLWEKSQKEDVALTDLNFESQEDMIRTLIQVSNDSKHPKQKDAEKLLGQLYGKIDLSNVRVSKEKSGAQIEKADPETTKKMLEYARGKNKDVL